MDLAILTPIFLPIDHFLYCSPVRFANNEKRNPLIASLKFLPHAPSNSTVQLNCFKCVFRVTFDQNIDTFRIVNETNALTRNMTTIVCLMTHRDNDLLPSQIFQNEDIFAPTLSPVYYPQGVMAKVK